MDQFDAGLIPDPAGTEALGAALAGALAEVEDRPLVIYLEGDLGAGKTTLARGCLRALGHAGPVPSPTYTLVEPYDTPAGPLLHIDLYRINAPEELEYLGLDEALGGGEDAGVFLVEWPGQGGDELPPAHLTIRLAVSQDGRRVEFCPGREPGQRLINLLLSSIQL